MYIAQYCNVVIIQYCRFKQWCPEVDILEKFLKHSQDIIETLRHQLTMKDMELERGRG